MHLQYISPRICEEQPKQADGSYIYTRLVAQSRLKQATITTDLEEETEMKAVPRSTSRTAKEMIALRVTIIMSLVYQLIVLLTDTLQGPKLLMLLNVIR